MVNDKDPQPALKSAYELALERLERRGIEPPREEALSDDTKAVIAEARSRASAALAQLEILHQDKLQGGIPPAEIRTAEEEYQRERQRIEDRRERAIAKARNSSS